MCASSRVFSRSRREGPRPSPGVIAAARHPQQRVHRRDRILRSMCVDKGVLHSASFAKYAAAFRRISRSIFSRAFSARSRLFSASRSVTGCARCPSRRLPARARVPSSPDSSSASPAAARPPQDRPSAPLPASPPRPGTQPCTAVSESVASDTSICDRQNLNCRCPLFRAKSTFDQAPGL